MSSPSKLFSCVEADAILKSPINNSTSKNHWSFCKSDRFSSKKNYCDTFYEIPGVKENKNRKAGFGFGKKTDLDIGKDRHNVIPPSNTYNIDSFVEINKRHQKGFTPRFSREDIAPMSYIKLEPKKMPGPGRYDEYRYNESAKWSMRPRVSSEIFPSTTVKIVPGPGTYESQNSLHPLGKYHLTNNMNSKSKVFNPPRSKRFNKSETSIPGPGTYRPKNDLSNEGIYVLSTTVSSGKRKMLDGRRQPFVESISKRSQSTHQVRIAPGPGSYRLPSDFGQYDETNNFSYSSAMATPKS